MLITEPHGQDTAPQSSELFSYLAYGLGIQTNIPVPEFLTAQLPPDLTIDYAPQEKVEDHLPDSVLGQKVALQITPQSAVIYLKNTGVFLLKAGQQVTAIPVPDATPERLRHALCGIVMAVTLYQKGRFVLHGSAINFNGQAIAFLGQSGEGKSSLAAAFYGQGYDLLTDDLVAVNLADTPPTLTTAGTPIKLHPDMAKIVGIHQGGQPLPPPLPKHLFTLKHRTPAAAIPLQAIYVLHSGAPLAIEPLSLQAAVSALTHHAGLHSMLPPQDPSTFLHSTRLAQACPIFQLQRPRDLQQIPQVLETVRHHVQHLTSGHDVDQNKH